MKDTPESVIIPETVFHELVSRRIQPLMRLACFLERRAMNTPVLTRSLLGRLLAETSQIEEFLDAYGARNNRRWHDLRQMTAVGKLFSSVGYIVLHIQHRLPAYRLLESTAEFERALVRAQLFSGTTLMQFGTRLACIARDLDIPLPSDLPGDIDFIEDLPPGHLPHDRTTRKVDSAEETVAHLATEFLNLAAASDTLHVHRKIEPNTCGRYIPDPISEEGLRLLENRFHNLQSMYDTFVSDTDTEELDPDLPRLRGHISVIYRLLQIATQLTHYYERHIMTRSTSTTTILRPLIDPVMLLKSIFKFAIANASRFLASGQGLCHDMLGRYAEIGRIEVPIPNYRGFHVRPSTLIARIAHHYGSEVRMDLEGEIYDASAPLELFRANEHINARKRRQLAELIASVEAEISVDESGDMIAAVRRIITLLAAQGKLVIYQRPLPLDELEPQEGESLSQFALDEIARMQALGKIDIESDIKVAFIGDKRVLKDIRLLAENGYGEDAFGNNVALPKKLEYLRR